MINSHTALLIIDMQKGSFTPQTPRYDAEGVTERINTLSGAFRAVGAPVIFIQHDGSRQGEFLPGNWDWEILDTLEQSSTDLVVAKTANDSFYNTSLEQKLKELGVNQVCITGCATDFCVAATVQSALTHDFNIIVVRDGHTTADRPYVTAVNVIEHYNWVWADLTPTKGRIELQTTAEIIG